MLSVGGTSLSAHNCKWARGGALTSMSSSMSNGQPSWLSAGQSAVGRAWLGGRGSSGSGCPGTGPVVIFNFPCDLHASLHSVTIFLASNGPAAGCTTI